MKNPSIAFLLLIIIPLSTICLEQDEIAENKTAFRVMTYNIRRKGKEERPERAWGNRLPLVRAVLEKSQPDIIGLQEVTQEQITDLLKKFPQYVSVGKGRGPSWFGLGSDEFNPIFYNKDKFTLLEQGTFLINASKSLIGWMPWRVKYTGWLPRICTWARFKMNATNQEFYVYNTHLDFHQKAILYCAKAVMQHITRQSNTLPVIALGDFNTPFVGGIKQLFAGFSHTKDSADYCEGPHATCTGWGTNKHEWIDHIVINNAKLIHVLKYSVIDHEGKIYASDHRAVFVDIELNS